MNLPEHILNYARNFCHIKATDKDIFKFVRMLFENKFSQEEIDDLLGHIEIVLRLI